MGLFGVFGGKMDEEIDDFASVGASVAVISQKDDQGGLEIGGADLGLEIGPEVLELGEVAMDIANAANNSGFWILLGFHF